MDRILLIPLILLALSALAESNTYDRTLAGMKLRLECFADQGGIKSGRLLAMLPLLIFVAYSPSANSEKMRFFLAGSGGNCNTCEWIAAEGEITAETPDYFLAYLGEELSDTHRPLIYLNSEGGNLIGAIRLGMLFRALNARTSIGRTVPDDHGYGEEAVERGVCYSACAYAFLGGVIRMANGGHYGVHQFFNEEALTKPQMKAFNAIHLSEEQIISGIILQYLLEMGIDPGLLSLASGIAPWEDVRILSDDELRALKIDNTEPLPERWFIEPWHNGIIAIIRQQQDYSLLLSMKTATLLCKASEDGATYLMLGETYDAERDADSIRQWLTDPDLAKETVKDLRITIDDNNWTHQLDIVNIDLDAASSGVKLYLGVRLTQEVIQRLKNGNWLEIWSGAPRAAWPLGNARFPLKGSAQAINLALRNCI